MLSLLIFQRDQREGLLLEQNAPPPKKTILLISLGHMDEKGRKTGRSSLAKGDAQYHPEDHGVTIGAP